MDLFDVIQAFNGGGTTAPAPVAAPSTDPFFQVVQAFSPNPPAYKPTIWPGGEQYQYTSSTDKIVDGQPITRNYLMGQLLRPSESYMDGEGNVVGAGVQDVKNDEAARNMLTLMDRFGVDKLTDLPPQLVEQLPSKGKFEERSGGFWSSLGDFLTNPGVMMLLGAGWAGIAGAGASAAGAGAGAAADLGTVVGAAGELGAGGALGGYGAELAASTAAAGGAAGTAATTQPSAGVAQGTTTEEAAALTGSGGGANPVPSQYPGLSSELAWGAPEIATGEGNVAGALSATTGGVGTGVGSGVGGAIANSVPAAATGAYQFPYEDIFKGILGTYLGTQHASNLEDIANKALEYSDPFRAQRPAYQTQYKNLTTTPSNFFEDSAIKDIMDYSLDTTGRKLASQGYNMSGNMADELTKTGMRTAFDQYMPYTRMIGESAGAFQGTQGAGTAYGGPAVASAGATNDVYAGIGRTLENIFRGVQPNSAQQATGTPQNQSWLG